MTVTETDIRCATAALGRAEIFDDRVTADEVRIASWAEAFAPFGFEQPDILGAVTAHYQQPGAQTPKPGDIIEGARKIRRERAEREKATGLAALPAPPPPDPQFGNLPIATDGEPVWAAYEEWDAIEQPCRTCKAAVREGCINTATGTDRKIPCVSRLIDGRKASA